MTCELQLENSGWMWRTLQTSWSLWYVQSYKVLYVLGVLGTLLSHDADGLLGAVPSGGQGGLALPRARIVLLRRTRDGL